MRGDDGRYCRVLGGQWWLTDGSGAKQEVGDGDWPAMFSLCFCLYGMNFLFF